MNDITKDDAKKIATKYFNLLIKKYCDLGYKYQIVEQKVKSPVTRSSYFLKFSNSQSDVKLYEIKN